MSGASKTPLGVVQVVQEPVKAKRPSGRKGGVTTNYVDKNRVEPQTRVTSDMRSPLEARKARNLPAKKVQVQRLNMASTRQEMPITFKGMPKSTFKGQYEPNRPL